MLKALQNRIIVTGHYGSGKTNLSINLALDLRKQGRQVVLADLDVVNPYFRTADFRELAGKYGIRLIVPQYANTNLDIPSLTGELDGALGGDDTLIIDVGGDDAGAYALGRYAPRLIKQPYDMLYVVNQFRYLTQHAREAVNLLGEIEAASRLKATAVVNNSNLSWETTLTDVLGSLPYAREVGELAEVPVAFTAMEQSLYDQCGSSMVQAGDVLYPVKIHVTVPWRT